ncbi:MAG: MFS transporter [SAR324 cluster bacterium]|nr:MFS transporter [SAR324 cluster bacterium]
MFHFLGHHLNQRFRPQGKIFYGWWIVASAFGIQWLGGVLWVQSYGAYTVLLHQDFGWSMTILSGAFALTRVESGILGPLQGWMVDRFGPRIILTIGLAFFGLGFIMFSQIDSILTFYISFFMIALGASLGGFFTLMVAIVNWFDRYRASAISFAQMGFSVGGLSVPLLVFGLERYGWRTMAIFSGIIILLLGIPLAQMIHHRPSHIGENPDGLDPDKEENKEGRDKKNGQTVQLSWKQALKTHSFWLISAGHGLALLTVGAILVHCIPHLTKGLGYSLTIAGVIFGTMTGFQFLGQFVGGILGDRFNKRYICMACMVSHAFGLTVLAFANNLFMVGLFVVFHGMAWGVRGPLMVAIRAEYFGPASFGKIIGISSLVVMLGMMGGPILSGYFVDKFGNYEIAFSIIACAALLGCLCFFAATPPKKESAPAPSLTTEPQGI